MTPPLNAAERGIIDEVIMPSESRQRLMQALRLLLPEAVTGPPTLPPVRALVP